MIRPAFIATVGTIGLASISSPALAGLLVGGLVTVRLGALGKSDTRTVVTDGGVVETGLNAHFSSESGNWNSGMWTCENGHVTESPEKPDYACDRYDGDACGEWTECVLAARYPREGEWGIIMCGRCGDEFVELNSPNLASWVCNECGGEIIPRSTRVRFDESNDTTETEQQKLVTETNPSEADQ